MLFDDEKKKILSTSEDVGNKIIDFSKGMTSFGSFFLEGYSKEVMTYLPYFQQAVWGVPMNADGKIWEYHQFNQLNQIKNYDFAIIFKHQQGNTNTIFLEKAEEYGDNKYFIIIQTTEDKNVGELMTLFMHKFMINNPYLKRGE